MTRTPKKSLSFNSSSGPEAPLTSSFPSVVVFDDDDEDIRFPRFFDTAIQNAFQKF